MKVNLDWDRRYLTFLPFCSVCEILTHETNLASAPQLIPLESETGAKVVKLVAGQNHSVAIYGFPLQIV